MPPKKRKKKKEGGKKGAVSSPSQPESKSVPAVLHAVDAGGRPSDDDARRRLQALDEAHDALIRKDGAKTNDRAVLENRRIYGETFRSSVVREEELRCVRVREEFDASPARLPPSEADEEDGASAECPICFETIPQHGCTRHACCGQVQCKSCAVKFNNGELDKYHDWLMTNEDGYCDLDVDEKVQRIDSFWGDNFRCLFCRQLQIGSTVNVARIREWAERGRAWAQHDLSRILLEKGLVDEGLFWLRKAVAQEYGRSEMFLATALDGGRYGLPQDEDEANRLMRKVAYKGNALAQYISGCCIFDDDKEEGVRLLTLSACEGNSSAQTEVGKIQGGTASPWMKELGIYWYGKAAGQGDACSQKQLAVLMLDRAEGLYGSMFFTGYSPVPVAYRWACRSRRGGYDEASGLIRFMEDMFSSKCASCEIGTSRNDDHSKCFLCCAKCKACFYCSKACQRRHWRAGHKKDCCDHGEEL